MKKLNGLSADDIEIGDVVTFVTPSSKTVNCVAFQRPKSGEIYLRTIKGNGKLVFHTDSDFIKDGYLVYVNSNFKINKPLFKVGDKAKWKGKFKSEEIVDVKGRIAYIKGKEIEMKYEYYTKDVLGDYVWYSEFDLELDTDEQELLELEAEALALILQLGENKGKEEKSSSNSTPKYKVGDVFVASKNDRYWKITSILTANEDITYFVDEYRKGKSKTYHTDQQSFSESELENKMLAQGAVLQKEKENQNSYPERNGKITADILKKTFDFRYVNVDINLDEKQEQDMLDVSYDTFRQLAMLLNIPMNAIGLGRNLTLNIGLMRMDLTTGACYSPQYRALNFKGLESFKHIAHEWFHAFDHYLNYALIAGNNINAKGLFSEECYNETTHYGKPAQDNIAAVIKAIDGTPYYSRAAGVAKASRFGKYWTSNCELLARAFEVYVKKLMEKHEINNSHLVSLFPNNPYPNYSDPKDMPIQDAFKVLFDGLTMRKTIYGDEALYGN